MRKSLRYGLIALFGVAVLAVVLPMVLVDEAAIKREIARAVENRTGRTLEIQGDLDFSLLPTPRFAAEGVRLANWPDSAEPWMVEVAKVSATVSPLDLLKGEVVARAIELDRPRVLLERRAGRGNWNFVPPGQIPGRVGVRSGGLISTANAQTAADDDGDGFSFRRLSVRDGRVAYRDGGGGRNVDVVAIALDVDAEGVEGPFRGRGSATVGNRAVAFDGDVGRIQGGRAVPVRLNARTGSLAAKIDGLLLRDTDAGPVLKAAADLSAADAAALLSEWGIAAPAPLAGRAFALGGQLRLDANDGELDEGQLRLGPASAAAGAHWSFEGSRPRVGLRLAAQSFDLDAWTAQRAAAAPGFALVAAAAAAEPAPPFVLPLPKDVDLAFDVSAASVVWRGQAAQSVVAEGEVSRGDLVINQVSVELPGAAQVRAFGFVGGGAAMRNLDLTVQASAANLRGVLDWLGVDVSGVPSDRLRRAGLAAQISGGKDDLLRVRDIDLALDATRARGALDLRWGTRPAFGLSLAVDQFNLDAYRPAPVAPRASASPAVAGEMPPSAADRPWQGFDANLDLSVGRLTVGGQPFDRVSAKGAWQGGVLDVAALAADLGGAGHLRGSGRVRTVGEGAPRFEGVKADVTTPRADRLLGLLPFEAPAFTRDWRGLSATLAADGPLADLRLDAAVRLGEVSASLAGRFDGVKGRPAADGELRLAAPTLGALAHVFGGNLPADLAKKGKVAVTAPIVARDTGYAVPDVSITAGDVAISGSAEVRTDGPRPFVGVRLEGNTLPWPSVAALPAATRVAAAPVSGFFPVAAQPAAKTPAWAVLRDFDGELTARFDTVLAPNLRADAAEAALRLNQGIVTLDRAAARLLGGDVSGRGRADLTGATAKIEASFRVKDVTVASNSPLFGGNAPIAGRVDLEAEGAATGNDRDALLRALDGKGRLSVTQGSFAGANLGAVNERLNRIRNLQDILGALDAGSRGRTAFDTLTGTFVVENGVLRSDDLALAAPAGTASAKGRADLAAETLDADLRFTLDNLRDAPPLGIRLAGAWAAPRVTFDTNAFQQHVLKKGLGDFLKSLSKPQSGEPPAPKAIKPKDVLREILAPIPRDSGAAQ